MNLLKETKEKLNTLGKKLSDIKWFGSSTYGYSEDIELFKKLSDVDYDNGFGSQQVAQDLVIVGKDFWLDRKEYDGSEWYEEHSKFSIPKKPNKKIVFTRIILPINYEKYGLSCGWEELENLNNIHTMTEEEKLRPYGEMMKENAKKGGQVTKKKLGKAHYQRMQKLGIQAKLAKKKQEKLKVEAYIKKNEQRNLY